MSSCLISLGRFGDICNILPAIPVLSQKHGKITFMVSQDYASILDGVSYCNTDVFSGQFEMIREALMIANQRYTKVFNAAVYGRDYKQDRATVSFCRDAWRNIGLENEFGRYPLIFDKRSTEREASLTSKYPSDLPWILFNGKGNSSPFKYADQLKCGIENHFKGRFHLIDIGEINCHRFYDLLGLYDKASILVTIDSGTLHLARASNIPTIALVTETPSWWHGAATPPNTVLELRYHQYDLSRIINKIERYSPVSLDGPNLIHVYSHFNATGETKRRNDFAKRTWEKEYSKAKWIDLPVPDEAFQRNSRKIGDSSGVPYIKDLVQKAVDKSQRGKDLIVLSNSDTCFSIGITKMIIEQSKINNSFCSHRYDFKHKLFEFYTPSQAIDGNWYCGYDLFVFTVDWWKQYGKLMPDMFLGREAWDWMLSELIQMKGGAILHSGHVYHEEHVSLWSQNNFKNSNPSQIHNKNSARDFLKRHGIPLKELA